MDARLHLNDRCTYVDHDNSINTEVNYGHKMVIALE